MRPPTMDLTTITLRREPGYDVTRELTDALRPLLRAADHGDPIPAVETIARAVGVSKVTVMEALNQLAAEGLVARRRGATNRVRRAPHVREISTARYAAELRRLARRIAVGNPGEPSTAFLRDVGADWSDYTVTGSADIVAAGDGAAAALGIPDRARIWRRRVVEAIGGVPEQIRVTIVPAKRLNSIGSGAEPENWRHDGGALAELLSWGLRPPLDIREHLRTRAATVAEVADLGVDRLAHVDERTRRFVLANGEVFAADETVSPSEGVTYAWDTHISTLDPD